MMFRHSPRPVCPFALMTCLALPAAVLANVGPPGSGGNIAAEPSGLEAVAITKETLAIDLRPLAEKKPVEVEAIYHLEKRGEVKQVNLVFVSGSELVENF